MEELSFIFVIIFIVGCENFVVYVVSDVFKRMLFILVVCSIGIVKVFYVGILGCGYWCNLVWVIILL